jgi:hypothetical protein
MPRLLGLFGLAFILQLSLTGDNKAHAGDASDLRANTQLNRISHQIDLAFKETQKKEVNVASIEHFLLKTYTFISESRKPTILSDYRIMELLRLASIEEVTTIVFAILSKGEIPDKFVGQMYLYYKDTYCSERYSYIVINKRGDVTYIDKRTGAPSGVILNFKGDYGDSALNSLLLKPEAGASARVCVA